MSLPTKALQVLIDLKASLLSREIPVPQTEQVPEVKPEKPKRERKPTTFMRHARKRGFAYQRYKQTGGW